MKKDYYLFNYNGCKFGKKVLFSKGNIKVLKNGVTLIVGENGTGKTTLVRKLLYRYYDLCTIICQENDKILDELTIIENLSMMQSDLSDEFIINELKKYELDDILNKEPSKLSGGEKRLVSILRGIWSKKEVIILDEPTNDLDYRIVDTIVKVIAEYKTKKTFVIVTHDERLDSIAEVAYTISDCKVESKYDFGNDMECNEYSKEFDCIINNNLLKKVFKRDYLFIYFLGLISLITAIFYYSFLKDTNIHIESIKDKHIEICNTVYGRHSQLVQNGFLPTSIIKSVYNDKNEIIEYKPSGTYSFGLNINNTDNYDVYNLLLFDLKQSIVYSVIDTYVIDILGEKESYYVDTRSLFEMDNSMEDGQAKKIVFEKKDYINTYSYLIENNNELENIFLIINPIGEYSFSDFINEQSLEEIFMGDYYIRSNETIELVEDALRLTKCKEIVINWIIIVSTISLLIVYYIYLSIKLVRKKVLILSNYGFNRNSILKYTKKRFINKKVILGIISSCILALTVICLYIQIVEFNLFTLIVPIGYVLFITMIYLIYNKFLKNCIIKIHNVEGEL